MFIFLVCTSVVQAKDLKIAVLNTEFVLENSVAIKDARVIIQNISDKIEEELTQKEIELKRKEFDLIQQHDFIPAQEYNKKISDFNKEVSNTQKKMRGKKKSLEKSYTSVMQAVHKEIMNIVTALAADEGYDIILPNSQVIFSDNALDITEEIIQILNTSLKKVKIEYEHEPS
ncbi:MAG TPA: OmpH family outer membrane protein [Candidatus Megaira endosymbiont of Nemacystus decipiens]|nr:OmpH family outer membrane protein [Candidatus Megaera endosymbiont of Nemacystus decipiens]